ncbi:acetyl-CoA hydrolase/transferase family protein [Schinkia azotoformans]|uniref:acetyl-CoA hydrolase/transferase family protein n=1 Tax=Schinkia azotoformans TaxID=1454 RepID=UPI002DB76B93|nr:acetyl-CoA hydrolase/transferase family protein [Schinkia azotoformans]MEC1717646.1 acetyl-CoA hydrolase/transferase family protein [Schinkia azotoformans]MEC1742033.1 acetyl-CoA hydrolase/transferase family protein [Schinkia azotoformans]MEC1747364.1 acetyl-CoA hydrolase/transferase family protein [Schinkia azotoformans]MEC1758274.1 acetyl-CoA hydrolase/transferase family protein [Schinkia azotoformans]MEC1766325.1 acetyl-CoA hydrolase/transferase family protein [Schinkia azotoformans]
MENFKNRIRNEELLNRVVTAEEAASWIEDGMSLGFSGFTRAGDVKVVPRALIKRAENESFKVDVYTGASLGKDTDKLLAESGILNKRSPFQADPTMRKGINKGDFYFVDTHLSQVAELIRSGVVSIDYAVLEAISITEDGMIIPTTQVGNSAIFAEHAKNIIIEINLAHPESFEGVHDIYDPGKQGERKPIPLTTPSDRIGTIGIPVDINKIKGIVINNEMDSPSNIVPPDEETQIMANHLMEFLRNEIKEGRLTNSLAPLQSGIGSVANAVLHGLVESEFEDLEVYSEVLQDAVFDLLDAGKVKFASCCSITISEEKMKEVFGNFDKYKDRLMLRPQEISNHPELIRRMGLISINTALEVDIYGNVNSTHVRGTHMMNGIGGSGDFARNARLAIFVTKSIAKNGDISSIVPFVSHTDHTEHDVDVIVTEQGYADLRGLAPRERVELLIENCAHPMYRAQLRDYYYEALTKGGQTPHVLEKAFSWHTNFEKNGIMLEPVLEPIVIK